MAMVFCPNCRSANSSCKRRCWICQKALAPPPANPTGLPFTYPQKMRLVRFEETVNGEESGIAIRIVYVKSVEDNKPVTDYWQALRDQQMQKLRRIYAGTAAALSMALVALFFILAPVPAQTPSRIAAPPPLITAPDNPLAHTILPPSPLPITESGAVAFSRTQPEAISGAPTEYPVVGYPNRPSSQAM